MKKFLFVPVVIVAMLIALPAQAGSSTRFAKSGTLMAGGWGAFDYDLDTETTSLQLNPVAAYFVIPGLAIGAQLPITYDGSNMFWGLSGLARYYYKLAGTMFLVGGGNLGYSLYNKADMSGFTFGGHGGLTIAFGDKYGGYVSFLAHIDNKTLNGDGAAKLPDVPLGAMTELGLFF